MDSQYADIDDIWYAYRLLLGRAPDEQGMETYKRLLKEQSLRPQELAEHFLGSNEFRNRYNSEIREIGLNGYSIFVRVDDGDVGRAVALSRQWEPQVVSVLEEHLKPGGRFLDVGANIGYFTAWGAYRVGDAGRVVAIEPMDKNLQLIYSTIARNGFSNVRVEPFAASNADLIVSMGTHGGTSNGEIVSEWTGGDHPLYAQARKLDDLLAAEEYFDVVKFDIEGHELHAWRGFSRGLERDRPVVLTEFHPRCLSRNARVEPDEYAAVLLDYGRITVLHFDGKRTPCGNKEELMRLWASEDAALRTDGGAHLDLLVEPRT